MVAGVGFEPTSVGHEPTKEPLLYPAMKIDYCELAVNQGDSFNFPPQRVRRDAITAHLVGTEGLEPSRLSTTDFPATLCCHSRITTL